MRRGVKKREGENLTDANVKKVIALLNQSPAITKKEACNILNISYNTSRLNSIIDEYQERVQYTKHRKAQMRGKPARQDELKEMIERYLSGDTFSEIASGLFRSVAFVKNHLERIGVPERIVGEEKYEVEYLPEECVAEEFSAGEIAWSAVYHAPCEVITEESKRDLYLDRYSSAAYRVWIREPSEHYGKIGGFFSSHLAYDLGKLEHLKDYGINTNSLT
jgi:hypothetical protein